jgi:hypothetical protein
MFTRCLLALVLCLVCASRTEAQTGQSMFVYQSNFLAPLALEDERAPVIRVGPAAIAS